MAVSLSFHSGGTLKTDSPLLAKHKRALDGWLAYLRSGGLVTPAPVAPPAPAMAITAADKGSAGNDVVLAFANVREDPNTRDTVFDAALTHTDIYPGLAPDHRWRRDRDIQGNGHRPRDSCSCPA